MEDLKILLVEDNPGDAFLVEEMLEDIQEVNAEITHIETLKEAITELEQSVYDVVLLDLGLPDSEGLNALKKVLEIDLGFPVIVITGLDDGKTGNEAVKSGAQSYMVKGQLTSASISQTILYSIERTKFLKKLKVKEAEVIEKNKVLEEVLSSKNLLISIISHDLRGPLNSIISLLEILDSDYDELEEKTKKKYLNAILSSAKSTHNLMENLLHWA
ncbi:MAG TPA: response regulator, partial [Prolixibacteraceae bacterium]|nr:response regulator [Prolixibacteraceae bacterium]